VRQLAILCYHALSPGWRASLSVAPAVFERQISHLIGSGWRPVTFSDAVLGSREGRLLAITFDDAFASVRRYAAPILKRLGAPATVFAPTAFVDAGAKLRWPGIDHWEAGADAAELEAMTWADLRALAAMGWEIGSHTCTHPRLTELDDRALARELRQSRERCAKELGTDCRTVAYPYGDVDARVRRAAADAGYLAGACLSRSLRDEGPHAIGRIGIYHEDGWLRFRLKLSAPVRLARTLRLTGAHAAPPR